MSTENSVKGFSFISYFLFYHDSCNLCAIPEADVDDYKVGLKVEDGEEKKEEYDDDLDVSDEEVDGTNADKEEDRTKNTK